MTVDEAADRPAENIMMPTARTTAATMIETSSAMPTAVITESSENTMSSTMICTMTAANDGATRRRAVAFLAFEPLVNLERRLAEQEQAAADAGSGRGPTSRWPNTVNSGVGQPDDPRDRHQQQDAHDHRGDQTDAPRLCLLLPRAACRRESR